MQLNEAMKALGLQVSPATQVDAAATAATTVSDTHSDTDSSDIMTNEGADIAKILLNDENGLLLKNMGLRKPDVLL